MTPKSELAPFAPGEPLSQNLRPGGSAGGKRVSLVAQLPFHLLRLRTVRFAAVGVAATLTHGGTLGLLASALMTPPILANSAGVVAASCVSYFGHRIFTFRSRAPHVTALAKFMIQFAGTWILTSALAVCFIPSFGAWPVSVFIMVLMPCVNYLIYARWTFR